MMSASPMRGVSPSLDATRKRPFAELEANNHRSLLTINDDSLSRASSILSDPPERLSPPPQFTKPPTAGSVGSRTGTDSDGAAKKRKLTFVEKEAQRIEKEHARLAKEEEKRLKEVEKQKKAELKEEEKRKKEIEKAEKEVERKRKEEERLEKKKVKDAEKQAKEDEKRKKEEELEKKAKAQMRLGAFFKLPTTPQKHAAEATKDELEVVSENAPSFIKKETISLVQEPEANNQALSKSPTRVSEYKRSFPPFFLISHTSLAPYNRFEKDHQSLVYATKALEDSIASWKTGSSSAITPKKGPIFDLPPYSRKFATSQAAVKSLVIEMTEREARPNHYSKQAKDDPSAKLKTIPMKTLKFYEDVRPPYHGTFTRPVSPRSSKKLARNPFARALPEIHYDEDSEAEWEEPEEGEELGSEDEEELGDEDDDMDDFLDDEEDPAAIKRKLIVSDMEPVSSGLCFEDHKNRACAATNPYRMEIILESQPRSINPFSTEYWIKSDPANTSKSQEAHPTAMKTSGNVGASPQRQPLLTLNGNPQPTIADAFKKPQSQFKQPGAPASATAASSDGKIAAGTINGAASTAVSGKATKEKKTLPAGEELDALKAEIVSSQLTKIGLIEVLKSKFASIPRDVIKNTLEQVARREGKGAKEKKWVLIEEI